MGGGGEGKTVVQNVEKVGSGWKGMEKKRPGRCLDQGVIVIGVSQRYSRGFRTVGSLYLTKTSMGATGMRLCIHLLCRSRSSVWSGVVVVVVVVMLLQCSCGVVVVRLWCDCGVVCKQGGDTAQLLRPSCSFSHSSLSILTTLYYPSSGMKQSS